MCVFVTLFTPKRQTIYQVSLNSFAGLPKSTHPSDAVWSEQCGSCDNNNMTDKSLSQLQLVSENFFFEKNKNKINKNKNKIK